MNPDPSAVPPTVRLPLPSGPVVVSDEGDGAPIVLIHGIPGSHRDFRAFARLAGVDHRVVRLDLPGFGDSPAALGDGVDSLARAVVEVMEHLDLPPAVLLGHSFGGIIATAVATWHPRRVMGLGLLASPGLRPHRAVKPLLRLRPALGVALTTPGVRRALLPLLRPAFRGVGIPVPRRDDVLVRSALAMSREVLAAHAARLRRVRTPTLVAWAEDDRLIEPAIGDALAQTLPDGPRLRFTQAGHALHHTRAAEIDRAVRAWLPSLQG